MTLDKLKKLEQAATPGELTIEQRNKTVEFSAMKTDVEIWGKDIIIGIKTPDTAYLFEPQFIKDAKLYVACRNMLPKLIAVAEAVKEYVNSSGNFCHDDVKKIVEALEALEDDG